MKVDIDTVSTVERKLRVELPADSVNEEFIRAYESLVRREKGTRTLFGNADARLARGFLEIHR